MAKKSKPYFALDEPLSDAHIFTILGRAVPMEQIKKPLGTIICPSLPSRSQISQGPSDRPCNSNSTSQLDIPDHGSAVTQVDSLHQSLDDQIQQKKPDTGFDLREVDGVDLYPEKAVECRNLEHLKTRAFDAKALAAVEQMIGMYTQFNHGSEQRVAAQGFRRIEVETPHTKVRKLLEDKRYAGPVIAFLKRQRNQEAAIVVSILTVSNMEQQRTEHRERKAGLKAQVPGPMEGNLAPTAKFGVSGEMSSFKHVELTGSYVGEVIVAIRYLKLKLRPPIQTTWWYKINYTLLKWTNKLPNQNEDIVVPENILKGSEGRLRLSSKEISGTAPVLLGDNTAHHLTRRDTPRLVSGEDYNFTIVA